MSAARPAACEDARARALRDWAGAQLGAQAELEPLAGDASFRRYFRVSGGAYLAMDAPPEREPMQPWLAAGAHLARAGVHVPRIRAHDAALGFALIEDLGTRSYLDALDDVTADALYGDALDALVAIQGLPAGGLPDYDAPALRAELELFPEWYLARHLQRPPSAPERAMLDCVFAQLTARALAQPQVVVHRDYHSRNLMVADPNPGILDYQDAVRGPVAYDLVSLLRDCYVDWSEARVHGWVRDWRARARAAGIAGATAPVEEFAVWFDWMGVQRHLKAIGIFARLHHRDGRSGYLADIPRTLGYVRAACARYPELSAFGDWLGAVAPRRAAERSAR